MWILAFNTTHDASICLMKDGEVVLHLREERLTHCKHDSEVLYSIDLIKQYTDTIDFCVYSYLYNTKLYANFYIKLLNKMGVKILNVSSAESEHHPMHACSGFFGSGFNDAVCVIVDGAGSEKPYGTENESIYHASIESGIFDLRCLYKSTVGYSTELVEDKPKYVSPKRKIGIGMVYDAAGIACFGSTQAAGKVMGMSPYGRKNTSIKKFVDENGGIDKMFTFFGPDHSSEMKEVDRIGVKHTSFHARDFYSSADLCYLTQKYFEEYVFELIEKALSLSHSNNLVLSGGCFLNCVFNYKLLKKLPECINLYVDPLCDDGGISYGAAKLTSFNQGIPNKKLDSVYLGQKMYIDRYYDHGEETSVKEVAELISNGNIVAIAQGKSESTQRALGNRSILFDPRNKRGKEIINTVKKRESWRPFAGTVLLEYAKEWFDMDKLEESPFMMYAVDVLPDKKKEIPSITHVDGTCRVQTVTEEQNPSYYKLIDEFYKLTGVPILFNTSFNLAGDTIVETISDALNTLRESKIEYLFLPELNRLVKVSNE